MKLGNIAALIFFVSTPAFAVSSALAQENPKTLSPDEQIASCIVQSGQYQTAFGQTRLQVLEAQKQIASLQKQLADEKAKNAPKPDDPTK